MIELMIAFVAGLVVGFVVGALVMRNNYTHFRKDESEFRALLKDKKLTAEQKILRIRNRLSL